MPAKEFENLPLIKPGRRPTISKEDVAKAIEESRSNGGVSLKGVYKVLGRGSYSTIGPLYRELMGIGQSGPRDAEPDGAPPSRAEIAELKKELARAGARLEMVAMARERDQRALDAVAADNDELKVRAKELSEAKKDASRLRERAAVAEATLKSMDKEIKELRSEMADGNAKLSGGDEAIKQLRERVDELRRKNEKMEEEQGMMENFLAYLALEIYAYNAAEASYEEDKRREREMREMEERNRQLHAQRKEPANRREDGAK